MALLVSLISLASVGVQAAESTHPAQGPVLLALARDYELVMLVGQYDPTHKKWLPNTHDFVPPGVQAPFTLFGVNGKIADVHLSNSYKMRHDEQPWNWQENITAWDRSATPLALALFGEWPDAPRHAQILPLEEIDAVSAVSAFLKAQHLDVSRPRLTQVLRVDLNGDGQESTVICANSDNSALNDSDSAVVYSLAFLQANVNGRTVTFPLRTAAAFKPTRQSVDDFERHHGRPAFFQVLALADIEQKGRMDIALLNNDPHDGPEVDFYSLAGSQVAHPLTFRVVYF